MRIRLVAITCLVLVCISLLIVSLSSAQAPDGAGDVSVAAIAPGAISIQGRLTNASGVPLNGTYTMTFRLYETADAVGQLCGDVRDVLVTNGLFNDVIDHCYNFLTGQKVWLGITVGSDPEMTPRTVIYPAPYALTLVPGAESKGDVIGDAVLTLQNVSPTGTGLLAQASASTGVNYGVYGSSGSGDGFGGYFMNNLGGVGISANSVGGTALSAGSLGGIAVDAHSGAGVDVKASGTGVIQSVASSYIWVSGNDIRPSSHSDTTIIDMTNVGGARVTRGANASTKNVMLPITVPGVLYGQNVRVSAVDIYWSGETDLDSIVAVLMRRQTGVCSTASCYVDVINDGADKTCEDGNHPTGCVVHYAPTSNNVLSSSSGVLYLTLELSFSGASTWIDIGGVRLTLEHD